MKSDHLGNSLSALDAAVKDVSDAALRDHKTPLQNERGLERTARFVDALLENSSDYWVFSGDINDFKNLNSRLGYDGADLVLYEVGSVLHELGEEFCLGFRRGGDEFVLVSFGAEEVVRKVLTAISEKLCPLKVAVEGCGEIEVTTSFGYVKVDRELGFQKSLERADQACKAAKWASDGAPVEWIQSIRTGYNGRLRCSGCRSQFSISVHPDPSESLKSLRCMVCGAELPMLS